LPNLQNVGFAPCSADLHEDETIEFWKDDGVESHSNRGAQREATAYYLNEGYEPVERWQIEGLGQRGEYEGETIEYSRQFRLKGSITARGGRQVDHVRRRSQGPSRGPLPGPPHRMASALA
jgi:hypothetical protein